MLKIKHIFVIAAAALACGVTTAASAADTLYRYVNNKGVTVIDYSVPPEFVHKGYEILNKDGTVRKVVARGLTDEEMNVRAGDREREKLNAAEAARLLQWDESLLLRYSSIADIEAARDRELRELDVRISILRGNVRSQQQQVERNQMRAADIERSGGAVPVDLISAIDDLRGEISESQNSIREREVEMEEVRAGYASDIDRFATLLDEVELRRRYRRSSLNR